MLETNGPPGGLIVMICLATSALSAFLGYWSAVGTQEARSRARESGYRARIARLTGELEESIRVIRLLADQVPAAPRTRPALALLEGGRSPGGSHEQH